MLTLSYADESACIYDNGAVKYTVCDEHCEWPSQTIMQMVLAVMPAIPSDVIQANITVKQLEAFARRSRERAKAAHLQARTAQLLKQEALAALHRSKERLQSLQQEKSC